MAATVSIVGRHTRNQDESSTTKYTSQLHLIETNLQNKKKNILSCEWPQELLGFSKFVKISSYCVCVCSHPHKMVGVGVVSRFNYRLLAYY